MELEIKDYWELVALHKSLMAAKFDPEPYLKELQGSPLTSSLAFKVFDLLVESCRTEGNYTEAENWLKWQLANKSRIETQLLIKNIKNESWWSDADTAKKEEYILDFMAPLKLEQGLLSEITESC